MKEVIKLKEKIEELRLMLNDLIKKKENLQDSEVIRISGLLDEHLVEYHRLLNEQKECK